MNEEAYRRTFESWDKLAEAYQEKFMDLRLYDKSYNSLISLLPVNNPSILELGCGPGNISKYLLEKVAGLRLTGMDASASMIELAKINNPQAEFIVGDCRNLEEFDSGFHAVVAGFVLPYISHDDAVKILDQISEKLLSRGLLYLSFIEGKETESGYVTGSTGHTMYLYYYEVEVIQTWLEARGFEVLNIYKEQFEGKSIEDHPHLIIIAKK